MKTTQKRTPQQLVRQYWMTLAILLVFIVMGVEKHAIAPLFGGNKLLLEAVFAVLFIVAVGWPWLHRPSRRGRL